MPITISGDTPNFTSASATTITGVTTLNSSSGVLATQNGMTGIAKAWVNFNGTGTVAIRSSFNVSSITDNGTGNYNVNFTTAMPNVNYSVVASSQQDSVANGVGAGATQDSQTTSLFRVIVSSGGTNSLVDSPLVTVAVFSS